MRFNGRDKREYLRIHCDEPIDYCVVSVGQEGDKENLTEAQCQNISPVGILFRTSQSVEVGELLLLSLTKKVFEEVVEIDERVLILGESRILGRVVRIEENIDGRDYNIGVAFIQESNVYEKKVQFALGRFSSKNYSLPSFLLDPLLVIAGPCVMESEELTLDVARQISQIKENFNLPVVFKASYDKANRTSLDSFRGPGVDVGVRWLQQVKEKYRLPVLCDVHTVEEIDKVKDVVDVIQIPAFLCRQTDLIVAAAQSGCVLNLKKGQFLSPWEMKKVVEKAKKSGAHHVLVTERGSSFGYNNLVVDMRSFPILKQETNCPVIFDATHSVQLPGGQGDCSGGQREFVAPLARSAVASQSLSGLFFEVHPSPDEALSDGPNMIKIETLKEILHQVVAIQNALNS